MKTSKVILVFCSLALFTAFAIKVSEQAEARAGRLSPGAPVAQGADKLVYADFETVKDNRPVSNGGGLIQLISYEETPTSKSRYKGIEGSNPPAPELARLKADDPNKVISFDYELTVPNQYAGVGVEIHGHEDKDGKPVPDDVSGYKYLAFQLYATGVTAMRVEFISKGHGISLSGGYPQKIFKVSPGFNTYRIPLNSVAQPQWAQPRVSPKDVLKKLTSVSLTAFCEKCLPVQGKVVVDNLIFEN